MCQHLINLKLDELNFINSYFKKDKWALITTCHHISRVQKWTCFKWSMNVPLCARCHHPNAKALAIEINLMNF